MTVSKAVLSKQFRKLDEISDESEKFPAPVKLTLLQNAVRSINDLRIVETLDEFQNTTQGHGSSTPPLTPNILYPFDQCMC